MHKVSRERTAVEHTPAQPGWTCGTCGEEWPCAPAKVQLFEEYGGGRLDAAAVTGRKELLDQHAELFRAEEEMFFTYGQRGHDLLTDEQVTKIEMIYHAEKDARLGELMPSLSNAIGPAFHMSATTA